MRPRLSVIVPAYNEEAFLGATLRSLRAAADELRTAKGRETEIIVVDNASTDGTARVGASFGVRVVHEPHRQIAAARNLGAREAQGEIIVTCDADNQVTPNLLLQIDEVMERGDVIGGGLRIVPEKRSPLTDLMFGAFDAVSRCLGVSFGVLYTDRDTFWAIGGFPAGVYVGEDALFVWALRREARRRGKKFSTLRDAYIVTSLRKIDEFGAVQQLFTYIKFLLFPWLIRRRESCRTWYEVRNVPAKNG
jgi:glycosyltransferase involved in cell wall biosynthesis